MCHVSVAVSCFEHTDRFNLSIFIRVLETTYSGTTHVHACRIDDGLVGGDTLNFTINSNFIVDYFDGTKSIVVSTTSSLGGQNTYWAQSFLSLGIILLVLALLIAVSVPVIFVPCCKHALEMAFHRPWVLRGVSTGAGFLF